MKRCLTITLMLATFGLAAHGAEPKPPWQRLLSGADARKANELTLRIAELEAADNYPEAIRLGEELLTLRTNVQGEDHWQTADEKWLLLARKKVAALPLEKRTGWRQVVQGAREADRLKQQAQYAKAQPLLQEFLKWSREVLGEEHADTAFSYNKLATNLTAQGKVAEAQPLYQMALAIYRQTLGESHPRTAASYNYVAYNLDDQGQFALAGPLYRKALTIYRQTLGEDHTDTANCYNNVAVNLMEQGKYAEAEPYYQAALNIYRKVLGEDDLQIASCYSNVAMNLNAQGKYAEAEPLFQKALTIRLKARGEDHPDTAVVYTNLAFNLYHQGKYTEAKPLLQRSLAIYCQVFGEDHPQTGKAYHNIAQNLNAQGRYAEAESLFQKALDIFRKASGDEHPDTAACHGSVAANLYAQGKYAEAGPFYLKALHIVRKMLGENHPHTASCYNGVALNLSAQGKYAEAGPLYQRALDIRRQTLGEDHPETAISYHNLAAHLTEQGKHREAEPIYQKSLDIFRKVLGEAHPLTALGYYNMAHNLSKQDKHAEAEPLFQKALDLHRQLLGEDHAQTARSYNSLANNRDEQGQYREAEPLHRHALAISRKALGDDHLETALSYRTLAYNLNAQEKYPEALATLEAAARSYEAARLKVGVRGFDRAPYGAQESPYPMLAAARLRAGHAADAWEALEANLARGLLDEQVRRRGLGLSPDDLRQREELQARRTPLDARIAALAGQRQRSDAEAAELERLLEQRRELEKTLTELAVAVSRRELATLARVQAALPADAALVAWVDVTLRGVDEVWGCVVRRQGEPHWERLPGSGPGGAWIRADLELRLQFAAALAQSAPTRDLDILARKLYAQRLAPLTKHLEGVHHLHVATADWMAGVPIEALTDQYTVSYTPSGTYLVRLQQRPRPQSNRLLAVGDPVFPRAKDPPPSTALPPGGLLITQVVPDSAAANARLQAGDVLVAYAGEELTSIEQLGKLIAARAGAKTVVVKVWREGQEQPAERELAAGRLGVVLAKECAREAITARRQVDQLLAQLQRGDQYAELPGTQVELGRLAELFDTRSVTALTRADASEQRLDELRNAGRLRTFRYLHFATHGKANHARAFDSALLLTPPAQLQEVREGEPYLDGRLTAAEVLEFWQLDADLVTLSACESGLGRHGGGDGFLGFAQAFLLSGSRSVCLSLWQVDDTATALLMDRFYRNLLGKRADGAKPMSKAAALREAKEWLRTLPTGEALERLGTLTQGVVRGERPAREEMQAVPLPKDAPKDYRPYAHPRYWAAFILIGDPE